MSRRLVRQATKRLAQLAATFAGITVVTFLLVRLAPGEPALIADGTPASPASLLAWKSLRGSSGDGASLVGQYGAWLDHVLRLDFGRSLIDEVPVTQILAGTLPPTIAIAASALALSYLAALPLGLVAATERGRLCGRVIDAALFLFYSLPPFWVALTLATSLAAGEPWTLFPLRGLSTPELAGANSLVRALDIGWHLVLPVVCLSLPLIARTARLFRACVLEVLGQEFVRAARGRGLSDRRVLWAHVIPNALLPLSASLSLDVPYLVGGSVIVERVFTIRGMGLVTFEAMLRRDYPVILGVTVLVALTTMLAMAAGDLLHLALDPRARRGGH